MKIVIKIFLWALALAFLPTYGGNGTTRFYSPEEQVGKDATRQLMGKRRLNTETTLLRQAACSPLANLTAVKAAESAIDRVNRSTLGSANSYVIGEAAANTTYSVVYASTQVVCSYTLNEVFGDVKRKSGRSRREFENCIYKETQRGKFSEEGATKVRDKIEDLEKSTLDLDVVVSRLRAVFDAIETLQREVQDSHEVLGNCQQAFKEYSSGDEERDRNETSDEEKSFDGRKNEED